MGKIHDAMREAFMYGVPFSGGNCQVTVEEGTGAVDMWLHGSRLARRIKKRLWVTTAGYPSVTTKRYLCALPGVRVYTVKHVLHLNDEVWDDHRWMTRVNEYPWEPERPVPTPSDPERLRRLALEGDEDARLALERYEARLH